jgi:hypothetical protein
VHTTHHIQIWNLKISSTFTVERFLSLPYRRREVVLISNQILVESWFKYSRRGRDRMVVGFTTTYAISAYHHRDWCCEFESRSGRGVQHYVIKFVSDLRQNGDKRKTCGRGHLWQIIRQTEDIRPWSSVTDNWPPQYNWNIVESGVKHHQTNTFLNILDF